MVMLAFMLNKASSSHTPAPAQTRNQSSFLMPFCAYIVMRNTLLILLHFNYTECIGAEQTLWLSSMMAKWLCLNWCVRARALAPDAQYAIAQIPLTGIFLFLFKQMQCAQQVHANKLYEIYISFRYGNMRLRNFSHGRRLQSRLHFIYFFFLLNYCIVVLICPAAYQLPIELLHSLIKF